MSRRIILLIAGIAVLGSVIAFGALSQERGSLRRAIENVVRNAVQYTAEGTEVQVEVRCSDVAAITIRDHGAGVPEHALGEIFRPFYRVDDARDREAGGVGLGLAIANRAVRLHGGSVEAANAYEGGLVVTIELPVSKQQTANSKQLSPP